MKIVQVWLLTLLSSCWCLLSAVTPVHVPPSGKIIVAYVTSWNPIIPEPQWVTHINYAFGHVNETFDGIRIDNPERLQMISGMKKEYPHLKVMLSIGGWGSGRFSEMAATEATRLSFAKDCRKIVEDFGLDGVDMDWEYPTSAAAGISSSPDDTEHFTILMRNIREAIGNDKLLTMASVSSARFVDFPAIDEYMDFINIMSYDMGRPPFHHSPLYRSSIAGRTTVDEAVEYHLAAGVPASKLVLGMPFLWAGRKNDFRLYRLS